ncbi:MAG: anthranilate synthase component 1 [Deltaproteobacteria bacterium]|nr:anthranilate synthase component 1 [Deltaproteobacteria bacterium]
MQAYTVIKECKVNSDPYSLFCELSKDLEDAVLLESKDGNGKNNIASMLFLKTALRFEAFKNRVIITILTENGKKALSAVKSELEKIALFSPLADGAEVIFKSELAEGDDIARIKSIYPGDVIRIFANRWNLGTDNINKRLSLPGVFSYDFLDSFEKLPEAKDDTLNFPDYIFYLPEESVIVDHEKHLASVIIHGYDATSYDEQYKSDSKRAEELAGFVESIKESHEVAYNKVGSFDMNLDAKSDMSDREYADLVIKMKTHIVKGDVFQIVPSRTFLADCDNSLKTYGVLRQLNPSPYLFYMKHKDFELFGSSPETSVKVYGTPKTASIRPIAGTRRRGYLKDGTLDKDLDGRLEAELKLNEKEVAEHMMLVDLARNDIARVSKPGTRYVEKLLEVERYSHVMHLVSIVEGVLKDDLDALHAYIASANMGTLVGSPKIEAASILRKNENDKRGPYGGAVGYITSDGEMDTAIIIRSAIVKDGVARVRAGAGVVFDSDPMAEAAETRAKASAVLKAIAIAKEV